MLRKHQKNAKITFSILSIFIGLFLVSFNYFDEIKNNLFNKKNISLYETNIVLAYELNEINEEEIDVSDEIVNYYDFSNHPTDYIGILNIPKIGLERGFLAIDSEYNDVKYNIMQIEGSTMPNIPNSNLILAAHSGLSSISYFNKLYFLAIGDTASITYHNRKYNYQLVNIYYEEKDGNLTISRDSSKTVLTLITCTKDDNSSQSIYIFELTNIE